VAQEPASPPQSASVLQVVKASADKGRKLVKKKKIMREKKNKFLTNFFIF
jgi:hypothetical protein